MKKLTFMLIVLLSPAVNYSQVDGSLSPTSINQFNQFAPDFLVSSLISTYLSSRMFSNDIYEDARAHDRKKALWEQAKAVDLMNIILDYYDKQRKYPASVPDGWHNVVAMNYSNICREGKALVSNNEVICYVIDDWEVKEIKEASSISACISSIELQKEEDGKSKKYTRKLDLYFMDYIIDQNARTTAPEVPGKASFWSDPEVTGEEIILYVDGELKGKFFSNYGSDNPDCGDKGTLTFKCKPGTHDYRAVNYENVWRGNIVIYPGECTLQVLSTTNNTASEAQELTAPAND